MSIQTDRGALYRAEIGGEPSPLLPDPDHAGVGSRTIWISINHNRGYPTWVAAYFFSE